MYEKDEFEEDLVWWENWHEDQRKQREYWEIEAAKWVTYYDRSYSHYRCAPAPYTGGWRKGSRTNPKLKNEYLQTIYHMNEGIKVRAKRHNETYIDPWESKQRYNWKNNGWKNQGKRKRQWDRKRKKGEDYGQIEKYWILYT